MQKRTSSSCCAPVLCLHAKQRLPGGEYPVVRSVRNCNANIKQRKFSILIITVMSRLLCLLSCARHQTATLCCIAHVLPVRDTYKQLGYLQTINTSRY